MSYNFAICLPPVASTDQAAWQELDPILDEEGPASPQFVELHARLTKRFPCICDLTEELVDDGVWSDGPLIDNFGPRGAVLGVSYSRVEDVLPFVITTANQMGMAVFDWGTEKIHRP